HAFGRALLVRDFNGDRYADLAVGAPGDVAGGQAGAGSVTVIPGSKTGLDPAHAVRLTEATAGVGGAGAGDAFGWALASADLTGDGHPDLVVGAPREQVSGVVGGAVYLLPGTATGPTGTGTTRLAGADVDAAGAFGYVLATGRFAGRSALPSLAV